MQGALDVPPLDQTHARTRSPRLPVERAGTILIVQERATGVRTHVSLVTPPQKQRCRCFAFCGVSCRVCVISDGGTERASSNSRLVDWLWRDGDQFWQLKYFFGFV